VFFLWKDSFFFQVYSYVHTLFGPFLPLTSLPLLSPLPPSF
jgi:hypothetical protein